MPRLTSALMFVVLCPLLLLAQETDSSVQKQRVGSTESVQSDALVLSVAQNDSSGPIGDADSVGSSSRQGGSAEQQKQKQKPTKPSTSTESPRPPIEGSMVGYIDNAIVGSQVRIRLDGAFDDNFPDRSEFFYAKCACYTQLNGTPLQGAYDPKAAGPGPGIPTTLNFQQLYLNAEYAPIPRFSVFAEVPFRWIQPQGFVTTPFNFAPFGNQSGISDVQAGFKFALLASSNHFLTFQFRTFFPSGDSRKGLGTNHYSVEPSALYYQKITGRMALEAQLGDWHPIGGDAGVNVPVKTSEGFAGDIFTYGIGPSYQLYQGERIRFTPVIELFGWRVLSGFQTEKPGFSEVSGINVINLKIGARTSIGNHNSFYAGFGQAVTHDLWYKHIVRFEYRYTF